MDTTISDIFAQSVPRHGAQLRPVLHVALEIDDLDARPSRHRLDEVQVITFERGERAATRREIHGAPGLEIQIPDPRMSSEHGRLVRVDGAWRFEDPHSKNGAVVDGRATRLTRIDHSAVIQLGHTIFLLEQARMAHDTPLDVVAEPLAALATLHAPLAAQMAELEQVAAANVSILVLGETGTGKEVVARAVHALSRRSGEFVAVNCGAIPSTLIESELFGHKKGAFSGALTDRVGHVRAAHHGTLFLDEIGELSSAAQTALLRVLQQHEVVPVGDSLPVPVDLRIIAATHRDLPAMIDQGRFRDDLYGRLLGTTIALPPLRERRSDLGLLVASLLRRSDPSGTARVSPAAARALFAYDWPRNIRELERALVSGLARSANRLIDLDHLPDEIAASSDAAASPPPRPAPALADPADDALRAEIVEALVRHGGNVTAAAKALGKHREQLHRWARRLGIDLESFRR